MVDLSATSSGVAVIGLAAVIVAVFVVFRSIRALYRGGRAVQAFLADWNGEVSRGGRPASKGVPERLADLEKDVLEIRTEIRRNGGTSMRDRIDAILRNTTPGATADSRPSRD